MIILLARLDTTLPIEGDAKPKDETRSIVTFEFRWTAIPITVTKLEVHFSCIVGDTSTLCCSHRVLVQSHVIRERKFRFEATESWSVRRRVV